jgi:hypothetical protein
MDEIRRQPFPGALKLALMYCFIPTKYQRQQCNEQWPSLCAHYRGKDNSEELLRQKSILAGGYVVYNLDAAEFAEGETSYEQNCKLQVEEAALWYRLLVEVAYYLLEKRQREIFENNLSDHLAFNLALMGSPPDLIRMPRALLKLAERSLPSVLLSRF